MGRSEWDGYVERRTLAQLALGANGAAMQFHQLQHESEADAGALKRAAPLAFDTVEALEQSRQLGLGNADPGVAYDQFYALLVRRLPQLDGNLARESELEGVRDEVEDDLLPHFAVHIDRPVDLGTIDA